MSNSSWQLSVPVRSPERRWAGPVHRLPRGLAWVVSVITAAGLIDDGSNLIQALLTGQEIDRLGVRLCVLVGLGGTGLALAFRPRWAPVAFMPLLVASAVLPDPTNLFLAMLLILALAAGLLDWIRLALMAIPAVLVAGISFALHDAWLNVAHVLVTAMVALALGRAVWIVATRQRRDRVENDRLVAASRAREAEQAERSRLLEQRFDDQRLELSRELHDVIAHELTRISMQATVAAAEAEESSRAEFQEIATTARRGLGEMRRLMSILEAPGAEPGQIPPSTVSETVEAAVSAAQGYLEQGGMRVELDVDCPQRLPHSMINAVAAVLREASTNVAKHAEVGSHCRITVHADAGELVAEVANEHTPDHAADDRVPASGFGLRLLRGRVADLGGCLEVTDADGWWTLRARWPLSAHD